VIGLVLLWPSDDRPPIGIELGLGGLIVDADVVGTDIGPCTGSRPEDGILCQDVFVRATSGPIEGIEGKFQQDISVTAIDLSAGDRIRVGYNADSLEDLRFYFVDFQRRTPMLLLAALFVVAVLALGRWQGVRALAGLVVTGVVIVGFLFPALLSGRNPTAAALVAAVVIALVALYLTHGVSERTTVALLGALGALALTALLASVFAAATRLTGYASEGAMFLQVASGEVDIRGLVLAGIIIGSLGVLDDVTITQASAVWQLHRANPDYSLRQLYESAVTIGRDHIASAVNTLVLAYAGAALPLLLLFTQAGRSLGFVATGEDVAVEIVRTLVGSIGLIAAVPLTTFLAALVVTAGTGRHLAAPDAAAGPLGSRSAAEEHDSGSEVTEEPGDARAHRSVADPEVGDDADSAAWEQFGPPDEPGRW
jgi:uncharacterized membrane protein